MGFLICLSVKGQALGWAAAQPEAEKVLHTWGQHSCDKPPVLTPHQWGAALSASAPSGSVPRQQFCSASDGQGPPARPRSPPLCHTRPLSSADPNGLGSFLSHKPSHCPWEVLSLVFLFQLEPPAHHSLPRHNAALCGCFQHCLGNAVMGTGPDRERKGLCQPKCLAFRGRPGGQKAPVLNEFCWSHLPPPPKACPGAGHQFK